MPKRGKMKKIFFLSLKIIGVLSILVVILLICFLIGLKNIFSKSANEARNESKPITQSIEKLGGKFICERGGGDGVDSEPWLYMSYQITDSPELTNNIKDFARQEGYLLEIDKQDIATLQRKTDYLTTQTKQRHNLKVTIVRDEKISLYCEKNYTKEMIPTPGQAIIQLYFNTDFKYNGK